MMVLLLVCGFFFFMYHYLPCLFFWWLLSCTIVPLQIVTITVQLWNNTSCLLTKIHYHSMRFFGWMYSLNGVFASLISVAWISDFWLEAGQVMTLIEQSSIINGFKLFVLSEWFLFVSAFAGV